MNSDGSQAVELDQVDISYTVPPVKSSSKSGSRKYTAAQLEAIFDKPQDIEVTDNEKGSKICSNILTQKLKASSRNGQFNSYTGSIVYEAMVLQEHLNRLGFNSGPEDGIIGPLTDGAIRRMQTSLGVVNDGYIGPLTLTAINWSC